MSPCRVCRHSQRAVIDADLAAGCSLRTVAQRYKLGTTTVWRHRQHAAPNWVPTAPLQLSPAQAAEVIQLLADLTQLYDDIVASLDRGGTLPGSAAGGEPGAMPAPRSPVPAVRGPYVPVWLPVALHRAFARRLHAALQREQARQRRAGIRGQAAVLARGRVIGGVVAAFQYNRCSSTWGRAMHRRKGQQGLQRQLAARGVSQREYMTSLGRRGGQATARRRRRRDQPVLDIARLVATEAPPRPTNAFFS